MDVLVSAKYAKELDPPKMQSSHLDNNLQKKIIKKENKKVNSKNNRKIIKKNHH